MRLGEANWILWGLALQVGLCPLDRAPLAVKDVSRIWGTVNQYCDRCYREWYLDPDSGQCCGWWLTPAGWRYDADRKIHFR